jgi:spore germination protein KC
MKRFVCLILLISTAFLTTGCWSSREPKFMTVVQSALIDITDDGLYKMTAEILNPAGLGGAGMLGGSGAGKNPYITITGTGESVRESISDQIAREYTDFGAQVKVRFFSERYAKDGVSSFLDLVARERLTDEKGLLAVVKGGNPERVYSSMIGLSSTVGDYIENLSKFQADNTAKGVFKSTLDFIKDYYTDGKEPVTGLITLVESTNIPSGNNMIALQQDSSPRYEIRYEGLAAFRDDKLVGFMDGEEAEYYNILQNKAGGAFITVPVGEDMHSTALHIIQSSAEVKTDEADGKATIDIKVKAIAGVSQENNNLIDVTKPGTLKKIEESFNKLAEEKITGIIKQAQTEFISDIFGFGGYMHMQHPDIWRNIKSDWNDNYFANAEVSVTVKTDIASIGEEQKPITLGGPGG